MTVYSTSEDFKQPVLQYIGKKGVWPFRRRMYRLAEGYNFEWGSMEARKRIYMREGFEFDKASTPKFAALLGFIPDGEHEAASMVHDRFYRDKGKLTPHQFEYYVMIDGHWTADSSTWKRAEVDELFRHMCVLGGMSKPKAWIQTTAVKLYPPNWFKGF